METITYEVAGMTCGHCVSAVTTELSKIPGIASVSVDLTAGAVTLTSEVPLEDAAVRAAVADAGYEVRP